MKRYLRCGRWAHGLLAGLCAGLWLSFTATVCAQPALTGEKKLLLVTAPYPPFVHDAGSPHGEGMDIEIAREAMRRSGYVLDVQFVPWKRALWMLEHGEADLTTTISRSGDRDRYLAWSQGYRSWVRYHFYARAEQGQSLTHLDGLDGTTLGVASGYFYPDAIVKPVRTKVRLEPGKDLGTSVNMMLAGRTDYIVVNGIAGAWEIHQMGVKNALVRQPLVYSSDSPTYMAFSKARSYHPSMAAMNKGLADMEKDGTLARIEKKYTP